MLPSIQIASHGLEVTPTMREFIDDKFSRLERHAEKIMSVHLVLNVNRGRQTAEARLHIPRAEIFAEAESEDMYKTIDLLLDKIIRQLEKHREKHEKNHRRN